MDTFLGGMFMVTLCMTALSAAPGIVYMQKTPLQDHPVPKENTLQLVQESCEKTNNTKRLLTFNAALGSNTKYSKQRRELIPIVIANDDSDVICMQGLWLRKDARNVMLLLIESHPYSYSAFHQMDESFWLPPCLDVSLIKLSSCMIWNGCVFLWSNEDRLLCALENCIHDINDLNQECRTCLVTNTVSTCLTTSGVNIPGLLMLSKTPITNATATPFIADVPQLMPHYHISADVEGVGHVLCTQLTANSPGPYTEVNLVDRYKSFEEQNAAEVQTLITLLASRSNDVIMGDLNTSPNIADSGIMGSFVDSYNALINASYNSHYVDNVTLCTYCHDNPIVDGSSDYILDHVMTKSTNQKCAQRVYDDEVVGTPLSPHYGVKVDIEIQ